MRKRLASPIVVALVSGVLAACASASQSGSLTPSAPNGMPAGISRQLRASSSDARRASKPILGVYVTEYQLYMSAYNYEGTGYPLCTYVNNDYFYNIQGSIQSDFQHELIVPREPFGSIPGGVNIFKEPEHGCVPLAPYKTLPVTDGTDGFSLDGKTYYIARRTGIAVCKARPAPACSKLLQSPYFYIPFSVTANSSGVYAVVQSQSGGFPFLVYWAAGEQIGTILGGFANFGAGGIYFDGFGDLLALDPAQSALYVYTGCPAACTAHGPFHTASPSCQPWYGSLNRDDSRFMVACLGDGEIEVYQYNGIDGLTYLYSNGNCAYSRCSPLAIAQRL